MPYPIQPYPPLPLSTDHSKKKKKTHKTQNSKPANPPRSSALEPPQPTIHTELERAMTHFSHTLFSHTHLFL